MPVENLLHLRVLCKTIFNKQNAQGKPALIRIRLSDSSLIFLESNNISHDTAMISRQYGMLLTAQFNEPEEHERERRRAQDAREVRRVQRRQPRGWFVASHRSRPRVSIRTCTEP